MKRFFLVWMLIFWACNVWAQAPSVAVKSARHAFAGQTIKHATPDVSIAGYFYRLGKGEVFPMLPQTVETNVKKAVAVSYKRSLKSLRLEACALGLVPQQISKYSRKELEDFILSLNAFKTVTKVSSRYEIIEKGSFNEQINQLKRWAESQPDYYEANYPQFDESSIVDMYQESFHPQVKSMRILVVRDDFLGVTPLLEAASQYPAIILDHVRSVEHAQHFLARNHYDIVLTDYVLGEGNGFEVSMHIWNEKMKIPVILYSATPMSPYLLMKYNIVGELDPVTFTDEGKRVLNFLSNIVATGNAYPNL